jgi:hypothetical protein
VIFDDVVPEVDVWPAEAHWPRRRADALIKRFQAAFPIIHYDLFWETRLLNAQAFIDGRGRCVRLYGGLGRHREVGVEGLAFALAHETGHHLGGPPRRQHKLPRRIQKSNVKAILFCYLGDRCLRAVFEDQLQPHGCGLQLR